MRRYSCVFVVAFVLLAAGWAHAISIDGTTVVVPVVMHGHGAQSTEWRTDLWISNQTPFEKDITVTFYPHSASSSSFRRSSSFVALSSIFWKRSKTVAVSSIIFSWSGSPCTVS